MGSSATLKHADRREPLQYRKRLYSQPMTGCRRSLVTLAVTLGLCAGVAPRIGFAQDRGVVNREAPADNRTPLSEPALQPYEPLTGGESKDSDDVSYLDVNLSLKIRLLPARWIPRSRLFLTMSTRFGFYWGSRPGSPVIGKSYNPKLLWRWLPSDTVYPSPDGSSYEHTQYLDLAYAHESNGQLVHTQEQYAKQLTATPPEQFTNRFIHRGWDYVELAWRRRFDNDLAVYIDGKYFLASGFLQGPEDQYHSWENNPEGKERKAVDGLEVVAEFPSSSADFAVNSTRLLSRPNLTVTYATGYRRPFEFSTVRAELGFQVLSLPLALWAQRGYMSDLAMYYLRVNSYGIEMRFKSF
jgi:hypothetical protein